MTSNKKIKLFCVLSLIILSSNFSLIKADDSDKFDFFFMKDGYKVALEEAKKLHIDTIRYDTTAWWDSTFPFNPIYIYTDTFEMIDPVLVSAFCLNDSIRLVGINVENFGPYSAPTKIITEGDDIGKSNCWLYYFAERSDRSKLKLLYVCKPKLPFEFEKYVPYSILPETNIELLVYDRKIMPTEYSIKELSTNNIIDTNLIFNSDEFIKELMLNSDFKDKITTSYDGYLYYKIGIMALAQPQFGMETNRLAWNSYVYINSEAHRCFQYLEPNSSLYCGLTNIFEYQSLTSSLAPNPSSFATIVNFEFEKGYDNVNIKVYNVFGQVVLTAIDNKYYKAGNHSELINVETLNNGAYYVIIDTGFNKIVQSLSIIR